MEQELAIKLQNNQIRYLTQVEIPVTTADLYFPLEPRPLLVFVDGRVHLGTAQMAKDEELRTLLRKRGYRILELCYDSYSDRKRDQLYEEILNALRRPDLSGWKKTLMSYHGPTGIRCFFGDL
jgi:very-short-patch-repair endonuclease